MTSSVTDTWTTRTLLAWLAKAMGERGVESPRLCAEMLLAHVLKCDRMHLYMHSDRPASLDDRDQLRALVSRALAHEPVQYLVGEAWFFSLPFTVDQRVLIPRPATETLVEYVLQHFRPRHGRPDSSPLAYDTNHTSGPDSLPAAGSHTDPALVVADICTGSGCIAVTLAKHLPGTRVIATDISSEALDIARANAARHAVDARIDFRRGDLLRALTDGASDNAAAGTPIYDAIVSNPPYIPDHEWNTPGMVGRNVKGQEPELALRGGPDGLRFVCPLIEHAPALLRPGGLLLIEFADSTADQVLRLAQREPMLTGSRILNDCDDLPRVLVARRAGCP